MAPRSKKSRTPIFNYLIGVIVGLLLGSGIAVYEAALYASDATIHVSLPEAVDFETSYLPPYDLWFASSEANQSLKQVQTNIKAIRLIFSTENVNWTWSDAFLYDYTQMSIGSDIPNEFQGKDLWEITVPVNRRTYSTGSPEYAFKLPRGLYLVGVVVELSTYPLNEEHLLYNSNVSTFLNTFAMVNRLIGYDSTFIDIVSISLDMDDYVTFGETIFPYVFLDGENEYGHLLDFDWFRSQTELLDMPSVNVNVTQRFVYDDLVSSNFLWES